MTPTDIETKNLRFSLKIKPAEVEITASTFIGENKIMKLNQLVLLDFLGENTFIFGKLDENGLIQFFLGKEISEDDLKKGLYI